MRSNFIVSVVWWRSIQIMACALLRVWEAKKTNADCFQRVHRKAVQPWTSAASERMCAPIHANVALSSLQGVDHRGWWWSSFILDGCPWTISVGAKQRPFPRRCHPENCELTCRYTRNMHRDMCYSVFEQRSVFRCSTAVSTSKRTKEKRGPTQVEKQRWYCYKKPRLHDERGSETKRESEWKREWGEIWPLIERISKRERKWTHRDWISQAC